VNAVGVFGQVGAYGHVVATYGHVVAAYGHVVAAYRQVSLVQGPYWTNLPLQLPAPLFFFLAVALAAVVCYLVQRWSALAGLLAGASCLLLGWLSFQLALGAPGSSLAWVSERSFILLGREWALDATNTAVLSFMFLASGLSFLAALPASQGSAYYPFSMGVLAALVLSVTAEQYIYSVLFLWLAVILAVFVLAGGRPRATTGALRFLALASLGVMLLLTVAGYLPDIEPGALPTVRILVVLGFGLLLMLAPFHGQLVGIPAHTAPMVPAFMLSTFPPVVLYILFTLGSMNPSLFEDQLLFTVYRTLGTVTVAIGGIAAIGQRRWSYLVGYAILVDWGVSLIALGQGTVQGMTWAVQMLAWRTLSLLLVGTGLTILLRTTRNDELEAYKGLMQRRLPAVLSLTVGLLSLAGFPLTPGFIGRWPVIVELLRGQPVTAWVVILSGASVAVGTLIGLKSCLGPSRSAGRSLPAGPGSAGLQPGMDVRSAFAGHSLPADPGSAGLQPGIGVRSESVGHSLPSGPGSAGLQPGMDVREPAGSVPSLPGDRFATLIGMVAGTLALSLAGAFVLHPGPWIEMAGRMLGALSFLSM
jgi:formate hydrogenlyase subunit 3/multisubunit Na+/H+ antiporter MnhD subunit